MEDENCIFCKIVKGKIKSEKIMESENFFAFLDANPRAEGHTLVVPKSHFATLLDIPNKLGEEMLNFIKKVASDLLEGKKGKGFNIMMNNFECAGQVVNHAHIHVIPRKKGDGIRLIV